MVKWIYDRARYITTDTGQLKWEEVHFEDMFIMNIYSQQFIDSSQQVPTREEGPDEASTKDKEPLICISYIGGI